MAGASIFTIAAFNFGSREMYVFTYSVFDFIEAILINLVCWKSWSRCWTL